MPNALDKIYDELIAPVESDDHDAFVAANDAKRTFHMFRKKYYKVKGYRTIKKVDLEELRALASTASEHAFDASGKMDTWSQSLRDLEQAIEEAIEKGDE